MNEMQFSVNVKAPKEKVWETLWQDETFRDWAGIIDPGTYMIGELEEGSEIQFISGNGYGVTSLVDKLIPGEYVLLKHRADTKDAGESSREDQWTGGNESYALTEQDGNTVLTAVFDVPTELKDYFTENYPRALQRIKSLAEG